METTMYMARNAVSLSGKLIKIIRHKKSACFVLSCGHPGKQKRLKNGLIKRDIITVRFFGKDAAYYLANFQIGDFVIVNAVAQLVRNHDEMTSRLEFWGIFMQKNTNRRKLKDKNKVELRGKITTATAYNDNYLIVNILTYLEKSRPNTNRESAVKRLSENYKSITPVGLKVDGNAKELAGKTYTKGTWVDVEGFVYGQKVGDQERHVERIIAKKISIIGNIQKGGENHEK